MIVVVLRTFILIVCVLVLSGVTGITTFGVVLYLPVLLGQTKESMLFWGWITTIPAVALGGLACIVTVRKLVARLVKCGILASSQAQRDSGQAIRTLAFVAVSLAIGAIFLMLPPIRALLSEL